MKCVSCRGMNAQVCVHGWIEGQQHAWTPQCDTDDEHYTQSHSHLQCGHGGCVVEERMSREGAVDVLRDLVQRLGRRTRGAQPCVEVGGKQRRARRGTRDLVPHLRQRQRSTYIVVDNHNPTTPTTLSTAVTITTATMTAKATVTATAATATTNAHTTSGNIAQACQG